MHATCREAARQQAPALSATEKAGGSWCDCQHLPGFTETALRLNDGMARVLAAIPLAHRFGPPAR
jgi:hypothetical protein